MIFLLTLFLRLPAVDDFFCDPDIAAVAYSAQDLLQGGTIYDKAIETKPPATYVLFALLFKIFGMTMTMVQIMAVLVHAGTAFILYLIGSEALGKRAGILASIFYAIYSISSASNGLCPNFETWTILPVALGYWFLFRFTQKNKARFLFWAGFFAAVAIFFKQIVVIYPLLAIPFLWLYHSQLSKEGKTINFPIWLGIGGGGFFLPFLLAIFWFGIKGGLTPMVQALNPVSYVSYAASESYAEIINRVTHNGVVYIKQHLLLIIATTLALFSFATKKFKPKNHDAGLALLLSLSWLIASIIAVVVPGKFFEHYFILLCPPLCLAAGFFISLIMDSFDLKGKIPTFIILMAIAIAVFQIRLEVHLAVDTLPTFLKKGRPDFTVQSKFFWTSAEIVQTATWNREMRVVGECINKKTTVNDPIYVWDYIPGVYWYAKRRAPTRHFMYFEVATDIGKGGGRWHATLDEKLISSREELLRNLKENPPAYIVILGNIADYLSQEEKGKQRSSDFDKLRSHAERFYEFDQVDYFRYPAPFFDELEMFVMDFYKADPKCSDKYIVSLKRVSN